MHPVLDPTDVRRILVLRCSAIGDTVLSLPVLPALRQAFPDALITWFVERRCAPLLRGHPDLDRLMVMPRGWLRSPWLVRRAGQRLRAAGFDVSIDIQGLAKSAIPARLSGARVRIGFARGRLEGRECSNWLNNCLVRPQSTHVAKRNLELLRPLGVQDPGVCFRLPTRVSADELSRSLPRGFRCGSEFAVLNVGAGWPSKMWPARNFATLADFLHREYGLRSVLPWGNGLERDLAERVAAEVSGASRLSERLSLPRLASLCRGARLFVGSDTGPLHLAAAVGTPCVALFGPTCPERARPFGEQHRVIAHPLASTHPLRRGRPSTRMEEIATASVEHACASILDDALPATIPMLHIERARTPSLSQHEVRSSRRAA